MDNHTLTGILIALVSALILGLFIIVWFAVRRFVDHVDGLQASQSSLRTSVEALTKAIGDLKSEFVTQTQHREDMATLRRESALGRRKMDHCLIEDCPYEKTQPLYLEEEEGRG